MDLAVDLAFETAVDFVLCRETVLRPFTTFQSPRLWPGVGSFRTLTLYAIIESPIISFPFVQGFLALF